MTQETQIIMGMPITIEIVDSMAARIMDEVFAYFMGVDQRFSTYKPESEITAFNQGLIASVQLSAEMQEVLTLAEQTKRETNGYFDIRRADGTLDPSGIVKGWAIRNAARLIEEHGIVNYFVEAGGDIQSGGRPAEDQEWKFGIRNPFDESQIIKALAPRGKGIATSGTSARGQHIYNPHRMNNPIEDIVSLTVIGANVLEADRFATAAFAMGRAGIHFIEKTPGLEGYLVDTQGIATLTRGFGAYVTS
jgi:thiamine biosynthesis lipoprotein